MIIDFHTHTFPEKIAQRAIEKMSAASGAKPHLSGTETGLRQSMAEAGIDVSLVLPVATSAEMVHKINVQNAENTGTGGVYFAGAIHPDTPNIEEELDYIAESGLFGVKIHPDYQGVFFDDDRYIRIILSAAERGLFVVTHAGVDRAFRNLVRCTPDRVLSALDKLHGRADGKVVLAHMGGSDMPDEVYEKIADVPFYFDTSFVLCEYTDKCRMIAEKHGYDNILFATDSPWAGQKDFVETVKKIVPDNEALEKVLYKNALKLLPINR